MSLCNIVICLDIDMKEIESEEGRKEGSKKKPRIICEQCGVTNCHKNTHS